MTDLTGKKIANTYKDLLQVDSATPNEGLDGTPRRIQDGSGTNSALELSQNAAVVNGTMGVTGSMSVTGGLAAGSLTLDGLTVSAIDVVTLSATDIITTNITVDGDNVATSAGLAATSASLQQTIQTTVANLQSNINTVSATLSALDVQVSLNDVQINDIRTSVASNTSAITVNSAAITSVNTRIQSVSVLAETKASVATSANLESRINAVSVLAETKASASTSANLETRINAVSVLAETKASASTSVNLETRINAVSALAETKASASTSANLETRINAVSSTAASNLASASATLESHINTVSATLSSTNATLQTSIATVSATLETRIATVSSTLNTAIETVSATMATSISNKVSKSGDTMTGALTLSGDPTSDLNAATKQYVDNLTASGIHFHEAVRVENPGPLTVTYDNGTAGVGATLTNAGTQAALVMDGITLVVDDRVLIYEQADATQNGVYVVTDVGSGSTNWILTRSADTNTSGDQDDSTLDEGSYFLVEEGNTGAGEAYVCSTVGTITFGTTDINFVQFSSATTYTAGSGIAISPSRVISTSGVPTSLLDLGISDGTAGQLLQTDGNSVFSFVSVAAGGGGIATLTGGTNIALTENGTTVTDVTTSGTINVVGVASAGTSASLQTRINTVSSTMATSIGNSNSAITVLSATMATSINNRTAAIVSVNTRINSVSAAIPTNNNQLTNGAGYVTTDTDTTYTAGGDYGMTLSGTEFRLEDDRRRNSTSTDVYSGNTHDYTFYDASVGIRWYTAGAEEMRLEDDGDLHVDGNIVAYSTTVSDKRLKKNILSIDNALWRVKQLNGCTFTYLADERESAGLIAQEVEKVLPSAVIETDTVFHGEEGKTYKTLQYDQVIGLLVEAVKELTAKVEELENGSSN